MPRISMSGQEKSKHDWKEIQSMIMENLFDSIPEEIEHIKEEVVKILEDAREKQNDNQSK